MSAKTASDRVCKATASAPAHRVRSMFLSQVNANACSRISSCKTVNVSLAQLTASAMDTYALHAQQAALLMEIPACAPTPIMSSAILLASAFYADTIASPLTALVFPAR